MPDNARQYAACRTISLTPRITRSHLPLVADGQGRPTFHGRPFHCS
jgi:hypothetical protein